ncbi:MAG: DUF3800 domain-containing protein [Planctomycetes bacterium]|nr:DUF3800 domain-containing protein [Planctomycetota bacterium]
MSAAITFKHKDLETTQLIDIVREKIRKNKGHHLHFYKLKHEQRIPYVNTIAEAKKDLRTISIMIHKPSLQAPETFRKPNVLYFYAVRFLFERISWLCKSVQCDKGDRSAEIIFSNRSSMSYGELKEYIGRLKDQSNYSFMRMEIDWTVIKEKQLSALQARGSKGLQIADAVASSFYYAVQPSRYGHTEEQYAEILKPTVYHRYSSYLGYGLKFWPWGQGTVLENCKWVKENYK